MIIIIIHVYKIERSRSRSKEEEKTKEKRVQKSHVALVSLERLSNNLEGGTHKRHRENAKIRGLADKRTNKYTHSHTDTDTRKVIRSIRSACA